MEFLAKRFIHNYEDTKNADVRKEYGNFASIVGITVNAILFFAKFIVGTFFNSIAIKGDAFNNLSDAGSCIISIVSFKISAMPGDKRHPFGHARIEYLSSLLVSGIIIYISINLLKDSVVKIFNPSEIDISIVMIAVLILSIAAKLFLYFMNKNLGNKISSKIMLASAADSLSDAMSTGAVLISTIISPMINYSLDGIMGVCVSVIIFKSGIDIVKDSLDELLGGKPSKETVELISDFVKKYDGILGVHDLVVHDYGPTKLFATVHAEVDAKSDFVKCHDIVDNIERQILQQHDIHLVIHMDPVVTDDEFTTNMKKNIGEIVKFVNPSFTFHDFRMVVGESHTNLIFDVVVPYECQENFDSIKSEIDERVHELGNQYCTVITFDRKMY